MQNAPLWQILSALPRPALRELAKMTDSPFFNQRADVRALFQHLQKCLASGKPPTREKAFAAVFPNRPYDGAQLRLTLHFLTELTRQYLTWNQLEREKGQRELLLAQALRQYGLEHLAQNVLQNAGTDLDKSERHGDPGVQERRFQIRAESLRQTPGGARTQDLNLQDLSDQLEKSFVLRKLKLTCELLSHQAVFRADYNFGMLDAVLKQVHSDAQLSAAPEVSLYFHCCMALLHPTDATHFRNMKPLLLRVEEIFQPEECRDIMLLALNFCIRKLNDGDEAFAHEGLELYKNALEKGYLFEKGEISRFTFRNVVGMGLKIKAFDWVEQFIANYGERIAPAHRESMVSFNRARLEYSRRRYREAMLLLQKADYNDLLLNLAAKTLLLKIYYEADELRLLDALLDSMTIFLRRKKIIGYHKQNYQNIVRYCQKLLTLNRLDAVAVQSLRQQIENEEHLTEREWFLGVISSFVVIRH